MDRVHVVRNWPCGGGMERIVRIHISRGEPVIALFGEQRDEAGVHFLGLSRNNSIGSARRALMSALNRYSNSIFLFYNGYAMDWLDTQKIPGKAILYLHSDYPGLLSWARPLLGFADGCLCVNKQLSDKIQPHFGNGKLCTIPLPVEKALLSNRSEARESGPIRIGYSGRVEIEQKRLDRLRGFIDALEQHGLSFRVEVLGDGNYLNALRESFAGDDRVQFHGHLTDNAYRETISRWDYILFLSDYEGLPLSLIEGVASGCLPIYPDFHNGSDWISPLASQCFYHTGDVRQAAAVVARTESKWDQQDWNAYRDRATELASRHTPDAYMSVIEQSLNTIANADDHKLTGRAALPGLAPVWLYNRLRTRRQQKPERGNL
ncbi:MAG: glycosyltransferase [Puniceicoccaceae bacterium]